MDVVRKAYARLTGDLHLPILPDAANGPSGETPYVTTLASVSDFRFRNTQLRR